MRDVMKENSRYLIEEDGKEKIVSKEDMVSEFDIGKSKEGGRMVIREVEKVSMKIRRGEKLGMVGE